MNFGGHGTCPLVRTSFFCCPLSAPSVCGLWPLDLTTCNQFLACDQSCLAAIVSPESKRQSIMLAFTSCYASQTRKSEMGQRATAPHRSRCRYRVRMETTRAGPHERDLCQFGSIAELVRTKQESLLHPGMAAEEVANRGGSRLQRRSLTWIARVTLLVPTPAALAAISLERPPSCSIGHDGPTC